MAAWGYSARQLPAPGSQHPVPPTLGIHSCCLLCKTLPLLGGKTWKSKFVTGCWEQEQILNLPLHGPTCLTLAASPCPHAVTRRTGWSGAGCLGASQGNAGGLPPQTPAQQCPCSLPHWGLAANPMQAGRSYVLQLGPPQCSNLKGSPTCKAFSFPCECTLAVMPSVHAHCVPRRRFCSIWYLKSSLCLDAISLEAALTKGQ